VARDAEVRGLVGPGARDVAGDLDLQEAPARVAANTKREFTKYAQEWIVSFTKSQVVTTRG
jgi:hypothetical protein